MYHHDVIMADSDQDEQTWHTERPQNRNLLHSIEIVIDPNTDLFLSDKYCYGANSIDKRYARFTDSSRVQ